MGTPFDPKNTKIKDLLEKFVSDYKKLCRKKCKAEKIKIISYYIS
jgi:hypothetical protein